MRGWCWCLLVLAPWAGCLGSDPGAPEPDPGADGPFTATSSAFDPGEAIPVEHTCDGEGTSPPFTVSGLPNGTATVALIAGDPDAPTPQVATTNFTHWLLWNALPVDGEVRFPQGGTPNGAVEGANDGGGEGYTGPCPPPGSPPHRYVFTFVAVDRMLELEPGANRSELEQALEGHVIEDATLVGTYERQIAPGEHASRTLQARTA